MPPFASRVRHHQTNETCVRSSDLQRAFCSGGTDECDGLVENVPEQVMTHDREGNVRVDDEVRTAGREVCVELAQRREAQDTRLVRSVVVLFFDKVTRAVGRCVRHGGHDGPVLS